MKRAAPPVLASSIALTLGGGVLALGALALGCGSSRPRRDVPPSPAAAVGGAPAASTAVAHTQRVAIEAPHAGAIQLLTSTPEGDAILSVDESGGVRLWPALDGSREPMLVELPAAKELAVAHRRDPSGYTAVVRDETGGLYIARLDPQGRTLAHTTLGVDPPFAGIAMSTLGLVAWRADHHVLLVDGDGAIKGDLPTEPQQRVVDIATHGRKALALLDTAGTRKARWLTLEPQLAWGAWIDHPDAGNAIAIAIAPDLAHFALAARDDKAGQISIFETANTARLVNSGPTPAVDTALVFVDNSLLAVASPQRGLMWMSVEAGSTVANAAPVAQSSRQRHLLAAAGGNAILAREGELMLVTPTQVQYLGYGALAPVVSAPGPDGSLLVVPAPSSSEALLLDATLTPRATRPQLGNPQGSLVAALEWVGGDHWLVESSTPQANQPRLAIVNVATGKATVVRDNLTDVHYLAYEPSTKLVTLSFGAHAQVARLDLEAQTLDHIAQAPKRGPFEEAAFAPLAPAVARGLELVDVIIKDKPTVRWFKSAAAPDKPAATVTLDGAYLGTDPAGRVYAWRTTSRNTLEVAIYTDGTQTGTLPTQGAAALWPDPTGTFIAEAGTHGITLYRGTTALWSRPVDGVHELHWLTDGALAITHASGIARLDAKTGALTAVRCGWSFGLSDKPHPPSPRIEPICAQLAN